MNLRQSLAASALALLLSGWFSLAQAAPSAKLWARWSAFDADSSATISHQAWNDWLGRYVSADPGGINLVAYGSVTQTDRKRLKTYIAALTSLQISNYNRAQQRAYWINLYNALTIDVVLDNYPLGSIRDISSGLFSSGPWRLKLAEIEGEQLTLDDIEHRILRPIWKDPRIHYAVNCASLGCPRLQSKAFTAENTEALLETAAAEFINSDQGARVAGNRLRVSSIYDWFEQDFGGSEAAVISHLRQYAVGDLASALETITGIDDYDYDWRINAR
jgi:hypothetical protein